MASEISRETLQGFTEGLPNERDLACYALALLDRAEAAEAEVKEANKHREVLVLERDAVRSDRDYYEAKRDEAEAERDAALAEVQRLQSVHLEAVRAIAEKAFGEAVRTLNLKEASDGK